MEKLKLLNLNHKQQGRVKDKMENRLKFTIQPKQELDICLIHNQEGILLGRLEKMRIGDWMTWCLFLNSDCYLTAGCMDEVREIVKRLNVKANNKGE